MNMTTILHLGLGSFHRAHQARVRAPTATNVGDTRMGPGRWQPAPRHARATIAALQAQGGAYTLETVTPQGERSLHPY